MAGFADRVHWTDQVFILGASRTKIPPPPPALLCIFFPLQSSPSFVFLSVLQVASCFPPAPVWLFPT